MKQNLGLLKYFSITIVIVVLFPASCEWLFCLAHAYECVLDTQDAWEQLWGEVSQASIPQSIISQHPARRAGREQGWCFSPRIDREAAAIDRSEGIPWKDRVGMEYGQEQTVPQPSVGATPSQDLLHWSELPLSTATKSWAGRGNCRTCQCPPEPLSSFISLQILYSQQMGKNHFYWAIVLYFRWPFSNQTSLPR